MNLFSFNINIHFCWHSFKPWIERTPPYRGGVHYKFRLCKKCGAYQDKIIWDYSDIINNNLKLKKNWGESFEPNFEEYS